MSLRKRSIVSASWNIVSNTWNLGLQFTRMIFLARWLPVNVFGNYALASSIIALSIKLTDFGMSGAFLHRTEETEDEEVAASVHFTLRVSLTIIWMLSLTVGSLVIANNELRTALLVLIITQGGMQLVTTPKLILIRRVTQKRVALINMVTTTLATPVMLSLAWYHFGIWSLLALNIMGLLVNFTLLYLWRPIWSPHFVWRPSTMKYFLSFGSRNFLSTLLYDALDRVDDIWVGSFLGTTFLGYYSKAYSMATYPRKLLAAPINWVIAGTYAELGQRRKKLSQAFFTSNAILIRTGFFFAGLLSLTATEIIELLLGEKWLPMLLAFRLMLIFTMLDPIKVTVSSMIGVAGGKPELVARARLIQLTVLGIGLFILGNAYGIAGVALAVDIMLVIGIMILLIESKKYVDFSIRKLFLNPMLAIAGGEIAGKTLPHIININHSLYILGLTKGITFSLTYTLLLITLEPYLVNEVLTLMRKLKA